MEGGHGGWNKTLTVQTDNLNEDEVKAIIQKAGFKAESLG